MRHILVGQERHLVSVRDEPGRLQVLIDGQGHAPQVERLGPGQYVLCQGRHRRRFACLREGGRIYLHFDGRTLTLEDEPEGRVAQAHALGAVEAPMPGKVVKLSVRVGQTVTRGEELLVVEAMKMENAMKAPRAGTVTVVRCQVGEMVAPGVALVEIE